MENIIKYEYYHLLSFPSLSDLVYASDSLRRKHQTMEHDEFYRLPEGKILVRFTICVLRRLELNYYSPLSQKTKIKIDMDYFLSQFFRCDVHLYNFDIRIASFLFNKCQVPLDYCLMLLTLCCNGDNLIFSVRIPKINPDYDGTARRYILRSNDPDRTTVLTIDDDRILKIANQSCYASVTAFLASRHRLNSSGSTSSWRILASSKDVWHLIARHIYASRESSYAKWLPRPGPYFQQEKKKTSRKEKPTKRIKI